MRDVRVEIGAFNADRLHEELVAAGAIGLSYHAGALTVHLPDGASDSVADACRAVVQAHNPTNETDAQKEHKRQKKALQDIIDGTLVGAEALVQIARVLKKLV